MKEKEEGKRGEMKKRGRRKGEKKCKRNRK